MVSRNPEKVYTELNPALVVQNLTYSVQKARGRQEILHNISAPFPANRWTSIMGPSGSGKTTLLHNLAGLVTPERGLVRMYKGATNLPVHEDANRGRAVEISRCTESERAKLRCSEVSVVFQDFNLIPVLKVRDNIKLSRRLGGLRNRMSKSAPAASKPGKQGWFDYVVQTLEIQELLKRLPDQLSGGQQQRVAIARSLYVNPEVLLADEPTGNLDSENSDRVLELLRLAVDEFGQTVVMVTHDEQAADRGDFVLRMSDGLIRSVATTSTFTSVQG